MYINFFTPLRASFAVVTGLLDIRLGVAGPLLLVGFTFFVEDVACTLPGHTFVD
jgi:hypothetical protein